MFFATTGKGESKYGTAEDQKPSCLDMRVFSVVRQIGAVRPSPTLSGYIITQLLLPQH